MGGAFSLEMVTYEIGLGGGGGGKVLVHIDMFKIATNNL